MKLLALLRSLPPRTVAVVVASHLMLLAGILWGGMPYLALQSLLAVELLAINLASIALYPERGLRKHAVDTLKTTGALLFILFFVIVTYGVAKVEGGGGEDSALPAALASLSNVDAETVGWALAYVAVHIGIALWQALASSEPRLTWARSMLSEGATTLVAMLFMIFVAAFAGVPLLALLARLGLPVGVDQLLACLMVVVRCAIALVMATISESEMRSMAANPYLT
jgi:hypothetical protein